MPTPHGHEHGQSPCSDDDGTIDQQMYELVEQLRLHIKLLQEQQQNLVQRVKHFEQRGGTNDASAAVQHAVGNVHVGGTQSSAVFRTGLEMKPRTPEAPTNNFYMINGTSLILTCFFQGIATFAFHHVLQLLFEDWTNHSTVLSLAAGFMALTFSIISYRVISFFFSNGGLNRSTHTIYFDFPFFKQIRVTELGFTDLLQLSPKQGKTSFGSEKATLNCEQYHKSQSGQCIETKQSRSSIISTKRNNTFQENIDQKGIDSSPKNSDQLATHSLSESNVSVEPRDNNKNSTTSCIENENENDENEDQVNNASDENASLDEGEARGSRDKTSIEDKFHRFDEIIAEASLHLANRSKTDHFAPKLAEAQALLDSIMPSDNSLTVAPQNHVDVLWRKAQLLRLQAILQPKPLRMETLSRAYETAKQAHDLARQQEGIGATEMCNNPHVLLWHGITVVEYRLPAASGQQAKIAATKDFVEFVNAAYAQTKLLPVTDPKRQELLGTCCFVLGCFHIECTKTVKKLGWVVRKLVARFLPPTSFAEAIEFLKNAQKEGYYDKKALAAWLAVALCLDGKTEAAKEYIRQHNLNASYFQADRSLRKHLAQMHCL